jgi:hypothetical protein
MLAAALLCASGGVAVAQGKGDACVADLKKEYGADGVLNAACPSDLDCTVMAPPGNASARALLEAVAKKAEDCFSAAGLTVSKEDKDSIGRTRFYSEGGQERCAVLIAVPNGPPPEGVRAVCKPD